MAIYLGNTPIAENVTIQQGGGVEIDDTSTTATDKTWSAKKINESIGVGKAGTGKNAEVFNDYSANKALQVCAHAEGQGTVASGAFSHAEGQAAVAGGVFSHAEGSNTNASAEASHAEGSSTKATNSYSHAGGRLSLASGRCSFAHGLGTTASGAYSSAFGAYNTSNDDTLFSVGNGTDETKRSNAFEITKTTGKLFDKEIATKEDIPTTLPANGGNADTIDGLHAWTHGVLNADGYFDKDSYFICKYDAFSDGRYALLSSSNKEIRTHFATDALIANHQREHVLEEATDILAYANSDSCPINVNTKVRIFNSPTCPTNYGYSASDSDFTYDIFKIDDSSWVTIKAYDTRSNNEFINSCADGTWSGWLRCNDNGNATTLDGMHANEIASNPNLLINPDFRINQRGQSTYSSNAPDSILFTADGWRKENNCTVSINSSSASILCMGSSNNGFYQKCDKVLNGYTVTYSIKASGRGTLRFGIWKTNLKQVVLTDVPTVYSFTFTCGSDASFGMWLSTTQEYATIEWAKVEYGSLATPFVPPDPAVELLKCQRYYWDSGKGVYGAPGAYSVSSSDMISLGDGTKAGFCNVRFPTEMRIKPTVTIVSYDGTKNAVSNWTSGNTIDGTVIAGSANLSNTGFTDVRLPDTITDNIGFHIIASAEL